MPRRILRGTVVSDQGDQTVVVRVERQFLHPLLKKTIRRNKKYHAHDEANAHKVGEQVRIRECPPRSKLKTWEVFTGDATASNAKSTGKGKVEKPADASESSKPAANAPQAEGTEAHAPGANA